jgi:predicted CXXCH cytochrome family protein
MSLFVAGCGGGDSATATPSAASTSVTVTDTAGAPVEGATVFAIPVADVEALSAVAISRDTANFGNYSVEGLAVDEPLEDLVKGNFTPTGGGVATYKSAVTDAGGKAELTGLPTGATDKFFIYVNPADAGHLPGGSLCREPVTGASLDGKNTPVTVSTKPSAAATFIGTSTCLLCHADKADYKKTMHRNGLMAPGAPSALQDTSEFDDDDGYYNLGAGLAKFTAGDADDGGTTIWFYDYDSTRKFDKFKTLESEPAGGTVYATVRIYKDAAGAYMAQFTNVVNPADNNNAMTHEVVLTYGGGVYKQRPITKVDDSLFMIPLQFNQRGDDASADRTRKIWRDYHMDWWWNAADNTFKTKPAKTASVDVQCAPCHFNGYNLTTNADGYYTATGVADAGGETHPVTGQAQELNIGCETCHGPGSEHVAASGQGKFIVSPQNITPGRASMLCGQCHSRPQGNGTNKNDSPLDASDKMMLAGTSRADFLANYTTRHDAASGDMWTDGLHSKSHHQQYTDFIQTKKYRNGSKLLTCASCHEPHGPGTDRHQLSGVSDSSLCTACHTDVAIQAHTVAKTGVPMTWSGDPSLECVDCHVTKTSSSGAGSNPTTAKPGGTSGLKYYQGDITSHLFDVPAKTDTSPASPMPVPYTNNCGLCHNMSSM